MPPGKSGKARESRSWALRDPVPGLASDQRENGKVVKMGSVSVARELQRTVRKGPRWKEKNHTLQGSNQKGGGEGAPWGWVGPGRVGPV